MIKVYVQELSTYYNSIGGGGKWIDVEEFDTKVEELFCEATTILKEHGYHNGCDAEEYEIVDWECEVDINLNSIYHDIKALQELNELLKDSNADEIDKICFLVEEGYTIKSIGSDTIDNVYTYENFEVAVEEFLECFLEIPLDGNLISYVDYSKVQRDLEIDGYVEYNNKVYKDAN